MLKLIYKNILARRGRYCWIFIELCLVALISWTVLDEVVVDTYKKVIPTGYDLDRLVTFRLAQKPDTDENADNENLDADRKGEIALGHINRILDRVRSDARVESATFVNDLSPLIGSINVNSIPSGREDDSGYYFIVQFWPGTDFFKTFGITDANTGKVYEETSMSGRDLIISKSIADYLFPGEKAVGRFLEENDKDHNPEKFSGIVGVVNDVIYRPDLAITPITYKTRKIRDIIRNGGITTIQPVMRLKPGVNVNRFIEDFSPVVAKELRSGDIYSHSLRSFKEMNDTMSRDMNNQDFISMSVALFFFVNILLCMVGTFYLQTRKRSEETGVMRTFGASRGFIVREMLGEGVIITTLAWILGCGLYWLYIKDEGLEQLAYSFGDAPSAIMLQMTPTWIDDFTIHFAIVSLIIYAIMLVCVLLGIYIPARKIALINPVDALRDE